MNVLYPRFPLRHLPTMLGISAIGCIIAGAYGILHDQITYTLSPEYFTEFKSEQFEFADFGFPLRVYVAEIGFLATWWVGLISGWFLSRLTMPHMDRAAALRICCYGFGIVFVFAILGGLIGAGWGWHRMHDADLGQWVPFAESYGVRDIPHFVWVGFIHNCSYAGGLLGLIASLIYARRKRPK